MWAWIIPLLVQLLVSFLTELLKGLRPPAPAVLSMLNGAPNPEKLAIYRDAFVSRVAWKFWYGPKRKVYAARLFDKMQSQFAVNLSDGAIDISATVSYATRGLASLRPADLGDI